MSDAARAAVREKLWELKFSLSLPHDYFSAVLYLLPVNDAGELERVSPQNDEAIEKIIEASKSDRRAWLILFHLVRRASKQGNPISDRLLKFLSEVGHGERTYPQKPKGRNPIVNMGRDLAVQEAVKLAMEADSSLRLTRNAATENQSASDIVSEELESIGIRLSPDSVARIVKRADASRLNRPVDQSKSYYPYNATKPVGKK